MAQVVRGAVGGAAPQASSRDLTCTPHSPATPAPRPAPPRRSAPTPARPRGVGRESEAAYARGAGRARNSQPRSRLAAGDVTELQHAIGGSKWTPARGERVQLEGGKLREMPLSRPTHQPLRRAEIPMPLLAFCICSRLNLALSRVP